MKLMNILYLVNFLSNYERLIQNTSLELFTHRQKILVYDCLIVNECQGSTKLYQS